MKRMISIKSFFSVSSLLIAVIGLFVFFSFKFFVFDPIYKSALREADNTVISLKSNFEQEFLSNVKSAEMIAYNPTMQRYLSTADIAQQYYMTQSLDEFFAIIAKQDSEIAGISVTMPDGSNRILYEQFTFNYKVKNWAMEQNRQGISFMNTVDGSFPQYYCLTKNVVNTQIGEEYGKTLGTLIIIYRSVVFRDMLERFRHDEENFLAVVDENSRVVMSLVPDTIGTVVQSTEKYRSQEIAGTEYWIINNRIIDTAVENLEYLIGFIFALFFLLLALQVFEYLLLNRKLLRPIQALSHEISNIDYEKLDGTFRTGNVTELANIVSALNQMMKRLKTMSKRIVENQRKLYEVELLKQKNMLNALLSQINPHFLYNCFECINGIAAEYQCPEIVTISTGLAKIFRYSIKEKTYVSLRQELEIVRCYISIMEIKFPDKFMVHYDIAEELLDCRVLKMLLQPVVENAFKHGLTVLEERGELRISGKMVHNHLELTVEDSGSGIEEENLNRLQNQLESGNQEPSGIGLYNLNQRIKLCYSPEYGVQITNRIPRGTIVNISIPNIDKWKFEEE